MKIFNKLIFAFAILMIFSCVDQEFDVPPGFQLQTEDISNITIADLKATHTIGNDAEAIAEGTIIRGIVSSDDSEGNIYQTLFVQDGTAGLPLRIGTTDLNILYPRGRELFIDLGGLFLGDFNGLKQVGILDEGNNVERIPEAQLEQRFILGEIKDAVVPITKTISELNDDDLASLVTITNVEFSDEQTGPNYATEGGGGGANRNVSDCNGGMIVMRNSDFAGFASVPLDPGNGTVTGLFTTFGTTRQILIRDLDDVNFPGERCSGGGGVQTVDISNMTISDLKGMHSVGSNASSIPSGRIIKGIVSSDDRSGNIYQTMYLQDDTGGIAVRVRSTDLGTRYPPGTRMYINCDGLAIGDYNGLIQIGVLSSGSIERIESEDMSSHLIKGPLEGIVSPKDISLTNLSTEDVGLRVRLSDLEFIDAEVGNDYAEAGEGGSRNRIMQDCNGNQILMRNSDFSDFAGQSLPDGNGSVVAVLSIFMNDYQLFINETSDVNLSGTRCDNTGGGPEAIFDINFEDLADFDMINYSDWINEDILGSTTWEKRSFDGNGFTQIRGFDEPSAIDAWLITPEFDLSEANKMSFLSATAFWAHDGLTVHYSNDFSGDIASANWTDITVNLAGSSDPNYEWVESGAVDLSGITGMGRIAFRFQGDPDNNTSTFRIDDLKIEK